MREIADRIRAWQDAGTPFAVTYLAIATDSGTSSSGPWPPEVISTGCPPAAVSAANTARPRSSLLASSGGTLLPDSPEPSTTMKSTPGRYPIRPYTIEYSRNATNRNDT